MAGLSPGDGGGLAERPLAAEALATGLALPTRDESPATDGRRFLTPPTTRQNRFYPPSRKSAQNGALTDKSKMKQTSEVTLYHSSQPRSGLLMEVHSQ